MSGADKPPPTGPAPPGQQAVGPAPIDSPGGGEEFWDSATALSDGTPEPGSAPRVFSLPPQQEEEEPDPLIGKVVANRYEVVSKMGEGGMGTVYLARHVTIGKRVALKVLLQEYARKRELKERFLREAQAAASIGHENIIDITDFGETPDRSVFFAMEFLEGADLSRVIKRDGPMPWKRAKPALLQICRALGAAHAKSIIHRDMKPENVFLIEREGRPDFIKVLDFGIAKVGGIGDGEQRLTRTGMIFGTPEYMSPEQAQGHRPDHRVDVYAVGVIMYEMLTGEVPFKADTFMGILTKHIFEEPVPPSHLKPELGIPADVEGIILKALAKDREDRFPSMTRMAAAIQQASDRVASTGDHAAVARPATSAPGDGTPVLLSDPTGPQRMTPQPSMSSPAQSVAPVVGARRGRIVALGAALVVLVAGGVGVAVTLGGKQESPGVSAHTSKRRITAAPKVMIAVRSQPPDAEVFKGTQSLGKTPLEVELPRSDKSVLLTLRRSGYRDHRVTVVPDRQGLRVAAKLEPLAEAQDEPSTEPLKAATGDQGEPGRAASGKPDKQADSKDRNAAAGDSREASKPGGADRADGEDSKPTKASGRKGARRRRARSRAARRRRKRAERRTQAKDSKQKDKSNPGRVRDLLDPFAD